MRMKSRMYVFNLKYFILCRHGFRIKSVFWCFSSKYLASTASPPLPYEPLILNKIIFLFVKVLAQVYTYGALTSTTKLLRELPVFYPCLILKLYLFRYAFLIFWNFLIAIMLGSNDTRLIFENTKCT